MLTTKSLIGLISLLIIAAVFLDPVRYTAGDARNTLLTSEAIIQHGTIKLDIYCKHADLCGATQHESAPLQGHKADAKQSD